MKHVLLLLAYSASVYAFEVNLNFTPYDIFTNDSSTRRIPNKEELKWTVKHSKGCTASMLSKKYLITANHCTPKAGDAYTSGACLAVKCTNDITAVRVVENYPDLDVSIVEIKWLRNDTMRAQRYSPQIQTKASEVTTGKGTTGSKIFTVGFPGDKNAATYAVGYAKALQGNSLKYNIGTINGNSGGPVWKTDDYTLVSLTNNGPHVLGSPGWKGNDPENPQAWNAGPQMYKVYSQSKTLQNIFDQGLNRDVTWDGYMLFESE